MVVSADTISKKKQASLNPSLRQGFNAASYGRAPPFKLYMPPFSLLNSFKVFREFYDKEQCTVLSKSLAPKDTSSFRVGFHLWLNFVGPNLEQ